MIFAEDVVEIALAQMAVVDFGCQRDGPGDIGGQPELISDQH
jgi:hypothetical protein